MTKPQQFALNFRPMKPRALGTVKAIVSELYEQAGGVKEVMDRFDIGKSQAYAYTDEREKEQISFARVVSLTGPTATAAAEYLASRAGGVFCALPGSTGGCPISLTAESMREHGEAIAATLETLRDKQPTPVARAKALREIDESISALIALRGHFIGEQ
jgi:hypothetical protein